MAQLKPWNGTKFYLWLYLPSMGASITFTILFMIGTAVIAFRIFRTRTWFSLAFMIGGLFEVVGYAARIVAYENTDQLVPFALQSVLILVAPALFAASIYMTLHRLMRHLQAERHSIIRVSWLTKIFVAGDILSFLVQSAGASAATQKDFDKDLAKWIVFIGLLIQVAVYAVFTATTVVFQVRIRRWPTEVSQSSTSKWKQTLWLLYGVSVFILLRSAFRIVEYLMGYGSYLFKHEWPLYVFDAVLMLFTVAVYGVWYPDHVSRPPVSAYDELDPIAMQPGAQKQNP